ncbi:MAG: hypothetical protein GY950_06215 [bacterium]|nr:hypothetical protein [bacterium]
MYLRFYNLRIAAFLEFCWRLITSALADDDIKQLLTDYQYDLTDLDTGMGLFEAAKALQKSQKRFME